MSAFSRDAIQKISQLLFATIVASVCASSGCARTDDPVRVASVKEPITWPVCTEANCGCPGCEWPQEVAAWQDLRDRYSVWNRRILSYVGCNWDRVTRNRSVGQYVTDQRDIAQRFLRADASGCLGNIGTAGNGSCAPLENYGNPQGLHRELLDYISRNPNTPITPDLLFRLSMRVTNSELYDALWTAFRYTSYLAGEGRFYDPSVGRTQSNNPQFVDANAFDRYKDYQGLAPGEGISDPRRIPIHNEITQVESHMVNLRRPQVTLPNGASGGSWYAYTLGGHIGGPWYHYFVSMLIEVGAGGAAANAASSVEQLADHVGDYDYRRDDPDKTVANTQGIDVGAQLRQLINDNNFAQSVGAPLRRPNYGVRCVVAFDDQTQPVAAGSTLAYDVATNDKFTPSDTKQFYIAYVSSDTATDVPSPLVVTTQGAGPGVTTFSIQASSLDKTHPPGKYAFYYYLDDSKEAASNDAKVTVQLKCPDDKPRWNETAGACEACPPNQGWDPATQSCKPCPSGQTACSSKCVNTQTDANHCGGCGKYCHILVEEDDTCVCNAGACTLVDYDNDSDDFDDVCVVTQR